VQAFVDGLGIDRARTSVHIDAEARTVVLTPFEVLAPALSE
jgi:hypothetical protein